MIDTVIAVLIRLFFIEKAFIIYGEMNTGRVMLERVPKLICAKYNEVLFLM